MAKIWRVYEGKEPSIGGPWLELPPSEAIAIFELQPADLLSDLGTAPRFGNVDRDLWFAGYKHIVVQIDPKEGRKVKWRPGFYRSRIDPDEAPDRLIEGALVSELGKENVVRVEHEPTIDSQGRDALKIVVVIAPRAAENIEDVAALDALVALQRRLRNMQDERTPIIHYATEAELVEDASS